MDTSHKLYNSLDYVDENEQVVQRIVDEEKVIHQSPYCDSLSHTPIVRAFKFIFIFLLGSCFNSIFHRISSLKISYYISINIIIM